MKTFIQNLKPLAISIALGLSITTFLTPEVSEAASLSADSSIFPNGNGLISPQLTFTETESGDLYLATQIDGVLLFLQSDGSLSSSATPYYSNQDFSGILKLPEFDTSGLPAGMYPLYQIIVFAGTDVMNFTNWVGGLNALNIMNFSVGLADSITKDFDSDGWSDDDHNHDGYHDDDQNKDGYHDDDLDEDGYHDDDHNKDGSHDNEDDSNENESDDENDDEEENESDDENDDEEENEDSIKSESTTSSQSSSSSTAAPTPTPTATPTPTPTAITSVSRGKSSYDANCMACHGSNPLNNKSGILRASSAAATSSAIARNKGGMGYLSSLTNSDLQDIADYINSL